MAQELRDRLGPLWDASQVILRSGTPLRLEHLRRADYAHAAAVLIPGADYSAAGVETVDARTIKQLLSVARTESAADHAGPLIVAEIFDERRLSVARASYGGELELLASDQIIGRLIAQNVRHPGLSYVYDELLVRETGNEIYVREFPELSGRSVRSLVGVFREAVLMGVARPSAGDYQVLLNPAAELVLEEHDRLVMLCANYDAMRAQQPCAAEPVTGSQALPYAGDAAVHRRLLVLGWNHRVPSLLAELAGNPHERFAVSICSQVPVAEREQRLAQNPLPAESMSVRHLESDHTVPVELDRIAPDTFDCAVIMASERMESGEDADARSILTQLLLAARGGGAAGRPHIIMEMIDAANTELLDPRAAEVILTPVSLSHMLAQVALRRELSAVYDHLFGSGGSDILFRPSTYYGLDGRAVSFDEIQQVLSERGETALGVRWAVAADAGGGVELNPQRGRSNQLSSRDDIVVLTPHV